MLNQNSQKVAIYSRKSKFTGKGESIENQVELCRRYIYEHYEGLTDDDLLIYEDEGFSGATLERPQFKKMLREAGNKQFSSIVCYRLDRISRNISDFAQLIQKLEQMDISFVSIREQFDTASPLGRAMMYIASVFSQLERETIAERIRDNLRELAKTGRWLGGVTPTGYSSESLSKISMDGRSRRVCRLKLLPEEAAVVRLIFARFLQSGSLTQTETYLLQNGYTTKNGKNFTRFAIKKILQNPVYMLADEAAYQFFSGQKVDLFASREAFDGKHGLMAYNRTLQKQGKATQDRDISEWIVSVGEHEGLISGADWLRAREILEQNSSKSYRQPKSNAALLSGLLFCGNCGSYLRPKLSQRKNGRGEFVYSYLCELKEKSHSQRCRMKNSNGNLLDEAVCAEILKLPVDWGILSASLDKSGALLAADSFNEQEEYRRLLLLKKENNKDLDALAGSLARAAGTDAESHIIRQIDLLHKKGEQLRQRIEESSGLLPAKEIIRPEDDILPCRLASLHGAFNELATGQKRAVLRTLIKRVVWDGQAAHIYWAVDD